MMAQNELESLGKVLVIDDDEYIVEVISMSLEVIGNFQVFVATTGVEGLEVCAEVHPDVVVIDVGMPQLDGYHVVRALRGDPVTAMLPIVMVSARAEQRDKMVGLMSGADFYLTKPINPYTLVQAIKNASQLNQQQRHARLNVLTEWEPNTSTIDSRFEP